MLLDYLDAFLFEKYKYNENLVRLTFWKLKNLFLHGKLFREMNFLHLLYRYQFLSAFCIFFLSSDKTLISENGINFHKIWRRKCRHIRMFESNLFTFRHSVPEIYFYFSVSFYPLADEHWVVGQEEYEVERICCCETGWDFFICRK